MSPFRPACAGAALIALLSACVAHANPSLPDPGFEPNGLRHYDAALTANYRFNPMSAFSAVPDGYLALVERLRQDNQMVEFLLRLDAQGNEVGAVDLGIPAEHFYAARFDADGKLVSVALAFVGDDADIGLAVTRRTANGSLDMSFGGGDGRVELAESGKQLTAWSLSLDAQGRVTIAGFASDPLAPSQATTSLFLAQLDASGAPIASFGGDGIAQHDAIPGLVETPDAVARRPDGSVLVCDDAPFGGQNDAILLRYTAGGALDTGFASAGVMYYDTSTPSGNRDEACLALALHPTSGLAHMVVATYGPPFVARVLRVDAQGNPTALSDLLTDATRHYRAADLRFDPLGRVVVAASVGEEGNDLSLHVARFLGNGARDSSFGTSGARLYPLPVPAGGTALEMRARRVHLAHDARGRIVVAAPQLSTADNFTAWSALRLAGEAVFGDGFE